MAGLDSTGPMQEFVDEFGLDHFGHAVSEDGSLWQRFGVPYQPAWVFVDADGNAERHVGALDEGTLTGILDDLSAA